MRTWQHRIAVVVAAVWVVALPFWWARMSSWLVGCPYAAILPRYFPDIAIGAVAAVLLPAAWMRKPWAFWGLIAAALLLPVLKVTYGNPMPGAWVISMILLVIAALGARSAVDGPGPDMKRLALRAVLTPVYGFAALGTSAAYLYLVVGIVAGPEGIVTGRYALGVVLPALSLSAVFALWRVWLIGGRLWRYGAYIQVAPRDRTADARGLICACIAFVGFAAIAKPIYRTDDVVAFSIVLAPAACIAILGFLWSLYDPRRRLVDDSAAGANDAVAPSSATLKLVDLPGVGCGVAIGLLGVFYLVPRPRSGWGLCDWTVFYPLYENVWPAERPIVFDACGDDGVTLSIISGVLSLVCMVAGALAAATGRSAAAVRGAWAAALIVAFCLATLGLKVSQRPDAPYIGWLESVAVGALVVVGAAWLGLVGGRKGERWRSRLSLRRSDVERAVESIEST